jgi:paraquat-inducible protein B
MATFYKQNDAGEYVEADKDVDDLFRQKSSDIVSAKLAKAKEKIREEIEDEVRSNALETIKSEAKQELEAEYKTKLEASESKANQLDIALRRKTIAAEYGFKPETEQFLGDGSEEDMRAKADTLKTSFSFNGSTSVEKQSEPSVSKLQESTGIRVEI